MSQTRTYKEVLRDADLFSDILRANIESAGLSVPSSLSFQVKVQRDNLLKLLEDADNSIQKYEHIYPFVKQMCENQTIDPLWFSFIENILEWVLLKGRGDRNGISEDIKSAWMTYFVLLSLSMIDKPEDSNHNQKLGIVDFPEKDGLLKSTGKN